jgi:hypothetical protein
VGLDLARNGLGQSPQEYNQGEYGDKYFHETFPLSHVGTVLQS